MWWGAWAASLPAIKSRTGASAAQLGLALFAVSLASLPGLLFAGRIAHRRRLVGVLLLAFAVAGTLPALAESPAVLFALLLLIGATTRLLDVAINARTNAGRNPLAQQRSEWHFLHCWHENLPIGLRLMGSW